MMSVIKSVIRNDKGAYITFKLDDTLLKNIERVVQTFRPDFNLVDYKKYTGEKWLNDWYEFSDPFGNFNFRIIIKEGILKLKLQTDLDLVNEYLKKIMLFSEFAKYKEI